MSFFDHKLESGASVRFKTSDTAFLPTGTSAVLIEGVKRAGHSNGRVLDLGCGVGIVGVVLAHTDVICAPVYASDLSADAVELARRNYRAYGLDAEVRCGSLFEPWTGDEFDLIIDDISGVAEPVAQISPWFQNVPCNSGRDGTRLVCDAIVQAPQFLSFGGRFVFPVLSLSNRVKILDTAGKVFQQVKLVVRQEWPLPHTMLPYAQDLRKLAAEGLIEISEKFGMMLWNTEVYVAWNNDN